MKRILLGATLLPGLLLSTVADAEDRAPIATDRPGFSDGSNVVGARTFQIETGFFRTYVGGGVSTSLGDGLFRLGITDDFELRIIGVAYGFGIPRGEALLDPSIGFKYRLQRPEGRRGEITFLAQTAVPIGENELRADKWNPTFKLLWTTPVGTDTLGGNLVTSSIGPTGSVFRQNVVTLFFSRPVSGRLTLTGELFGIDKVSLADNGGGFASIAGTYLLDNDRQFDLRIGSGFNQRRDGWFLQAGFSQRF